MADCPSCGGILKFDIATQKVKCAFCESSWNAEDVTTTQMAEEGQMEVREFFCPNCGGQIYSTDKDITGVCTYCGSNVVFESRLVQKRRPDLIIPFQKTKEDCKSLYMARVKKSWFVPKALRNPEYIEEFRGIYMPYWISDVEQKGGIRFYTTSLDIYHHTVNINDTNRISGNLDAAYSGMYHDAASGFSDDISEKMEPFYIYKEDADSETNAKPFYPAYLSGFYGEPTDIDAEKYEDYFKEIATRQTEDYLRHNPLIKKDEDLIKVYNKEEFDKLDLMSVLDPDEEEKKRQAIAPEDQAVDRELLSKHEAEQKARVKEAEKKYKQIQEEKKKETAASETSDTSETSKPSESSEPSKPQADDLVLLGEHMNVATRQTHKLAMFPVWFMSYRNKDRVVYATVNGQTGRVNVDLPIDFKQFLKVFLIIFVALFAVFSLLTIRSYAMALIAVWFSALTIHMSGNELKGILSHSSDEVVHTSRQALENSADTGLFGLIFLGAAAFVYWVGSYMFPGMAVLTSSNAFRVYSLIGMIYAIVVTVRARDIWSSIPKKERSVPAFWFSTVAAAAGTVLIWINSSSDLLLYSVAALAMICIAITMITVVRQYNRVATRPLPQFQHQGGDDRA